MEIIRSEISIDFVKILEAIISLTTDSSIEEFNF